MFNPRKLNGTSNSIFIQNDTFYGAFKLAHSTVHAYRYSTATYFLLHITSPTLPPKETMFLEHGRYTKGELPEIFSTPRLRLSLAPNERTYPLHLPELAHGSLSEPLFRPRDQTDIPDNPLSRGKESRKKGRVSERG